MLTTASKKKQKKTGKNPRYAVSRYAVTSLPVTRFTNNPTGILQKKKKLGGLLVLNLWCTPSQKKILDPPLLRSEISSKFY